MKAEGINMAELARRAQLRPNTLTNWKSGKTQSPRKNDIASVSSALGVRPEWLLLGVTPMRLERVAETTAGYRAEANLSPAKRIILRALEADLSRMTDEQAEAWFARYQKMMDKNIK